MKSNLETFSGEFFYFGFCSCCDIFVMRFLCMFGLMETNEKVCCWQWVGDIHAIACCADCRTKAGVSACSKDFKTAEIVLSDCC